MLGVPTAVCGLRLLSDLPLDLLFPKKPVISSEVDNLREALGLIIDNGSDLNGSSGFRTHDGIRGRLRRLRLPLLSRELTDIVWNLLSRMRCWLIPEQMNGKLTVGWMNSCYVTCVLLKRP